MELTVSNRTVIRVVLIVAAVIIAGRLLGALHTPEAPDLPEQLMRPVADLVQRTSWDTPA